jgi:hypothetical protein
MENWKKILISITVIIALSFIIFSIVYVTIIKPGKYMSVSKSYDSNTSANTSANNDPLLTDVTTGSVAPVTIDAPIVPTVSIKDPDIQKTTEPIIYESFKINGRYVLISKIIDDSRRLDAREIQIYSGGVNIVLNNGVKITSTCGEYNKNGPLTNIIDNNLDTSGSTLWSKDCKNNGEDGTRSIIIDLGKNYPIEKVIVYGSNRTLNNKNQTMIMLIKDNDNKIVYKSSPILTNNLNYATYDLPNILPLEIQWS